jgi:hypothetical protein
MAATTALTQRSILITYAVLLLGTAVAIFMIGGRTSLPMPMSGNPTIDRQDLKTILDDEKLGKLYEDEIGATRERLRRLTELGVGAFSTVLGALIGFLSASWSGKTPSTDPPPGGGQGGLPPAAGAGSGGTG